MSRVTVILILFLWSMQVVSGQGWEITPYVGSATKAVEGSDGNFFVAGLEYQTTPESYHSVLSKLDGAGNLLWKRPMPGSSTVQLMMLSDGNLLAAGIIDDHFVADTARTIIISKLDTSGAVLWNRILDFPVSENVGQIYESSDGALWLSGIYYKAYFMGGPSDRQNFLIKLNSQGQLLVRKDTPAPLSLYKFLAELPSGNFLVTQPTPGITQSTVLEINAVGNIVRTLQFDTGYQLLPGGVFITSDNHFVLLGETHSGEAFYLKADLSGNVLSFRRVLNLVPQSNEPYRSINGITSTYDGGFGIAGWIEPGNIYLLRLDREGNVLWERRYGRLTPSGQSRSNGVDRVTSTRDGGFIITGASENDAYIVKTDQYGNIYANHIIGRLFFDENENCSLDNREGGLQNWLVKAQGTSNYFFGVSDSFGNYDINVDTGTYKVTIKPINPYWGLCQDSFMADLQQQNDTLLLNLPAQVIISCPLLEVDIATDRLRRCFPATYHISYCNSGTAVAPDAYVEITFDEFLTVDSASVPFTALGNQAFRFDIGSVAVGACGAFQVHTTLSCDNTTVQLGQVHCVEAHAFPDSLCLEPNASWDGSNIEVTGFCEGDVVIFKIENTGFGDMSEALEYIVVEDQIILLQKEFQLNVGEAIFDTLQATGSTYALLAQQSEGNPGNPNPNAVVENCGAMALGFSFQLPENSSGPFSDIFCLENVDSYDPNDKRAFPEGLGTAGIIEANTDLEYLIRFQNTGTDTAYTVVIKDKISPHLDISTIRPGASSHAYTWAIKRDNVVEFTFKNILLPDSTTNEAASHGFAKFTIAQQPDLPPGTNIHNRADIYFDFNAPVLTNVVKHTIGKLFSSIVSVTEPYKDKPLTVNIYPNPFSETTLMEIEGWENAIPLQLQLFDLSGKLIRVENFSTPTFEFRRNDLNKGLYLFQLSSKDRWIANGRLVVAY